MEVLNYVSQVYYLEYLLKHDKFNVLFELLFLDRNNYDIIIHIFSKYMYNYIQKNQIYNNVKEAIENKLIYRN